MNKMTQAEKILEEIGFDQKTVKIYLTCLKSGSISAPKIANVNQMGKTTVYNVLEELESQEFIKKILKGKTKLYQAANPQILKKILLNRQKKLDKILPSFLEIYKIPHYKPKISYYEGKEGIRKVFEESLNCQEKTIYSFSALALLKILGRTPAIHLINQRVKNKIYNKSLRERGTLPTRQQQNQKNWEVFSSNPKLLREMRVLPSSIKLEVSIRIYDNRVAVMSSKNESFAFIMQSQELSNFMKTIHQLIWGISQKV